MENIDNIVTLGSLGACIAFFILIWFSVPLFLLLSLFGIIVGGTTTLFIIDMKDILKSLCE